LCAPYTLTHSAVDVTCCGQLNDFFTLQSARDCQGQGCVLAPDSADTQWYFSYGNHSSFSFYKVIGNQCSL